MANTASDYYEDVVCSFDKLKNCSTRIKSDLKDIEKKIKKLKKISSNSKILIEYQDIERSYKNLVNCYKKSKLSIFLIILD